MNHIFAGRQKVIMYATIIPGLIVFCLFGIVPSVSTLIISFTNYTAIPGIPTSFVGLSNYVHIFVDNAQGILQSLRATLIFAFCVTVFQNVIALWLAHVLTKKFPGVKFFRTLIFMPAVLGVTIIGLMWSLIFAPSGGPVAALLGLFGTSSAFFGSSSLALPLVIFVQIWANLGFTTIVYIAGINTVPVELPEAAKMDGATNWVTFWRVTFPMIAPSVTVGVILAAAGSLRTYDLIYVLTDGVNNTNTLGMYMFNTAFQGSSNLGIGAGIGMIQFVLTLIVVLGLQKYLNRREEAMSS